MNPFFKGVAGKQIANYKDFVFKQVETLNIDSPVKVDLGGKCIADFRMNMQVAKSTLNFSVKSKANKLGELWMVRVEV